MMNKVKCIQCLYHIKLWSTKGQVTFHNPDPGEPKSDFLVSRLGRGLRSQLEASLPRQLYCAAWSVPWWSNSVGCFTLIRQTRSVPQLRSSLFNIIDDKLIYLFWWLPMLLSQSHSHKSSIHEPIRTEPFLKKLLIGQLTRAAKTSRQKERESWVYCVQ